MNLDISTIKEVLINSRDTQTVAFNVALENFTRAKETLLQKFNSHEVTLEIEGGPTSPNLSGTLNGRGNLFSFIGFPQGARPTDVVRDLLTREIRLVSNPKISSGNLVFDVIVPEEEIYLATPLPFESGNSWVRGIERGISGFSNYVYLNKASLKSRSSRGIESSAATGGSFSPTPYLSSLLSDFRSKL